MVETGTQVETLFNPRPLTHTPTKHAFNESFEEQDVLSFQSEDSEWSPNTEVFSVWEESQQKLFQASEGKTLVLGGDARKDSPGHSAKYGSYTLMDLGSNKIVDTQLIQVIF